MVAQKPVLTPCPTHRQILLKPGKGCFQCKENREEHGEDKTVTTIVYYSGADSHGRISFGMWWWSDSYHLGPRWCGQMFKADPSSHIQRLIDMKKKYREIYKNVRYS
jgi:hypothetical protein